MKKIIAACGAAFVLLGCALFLPITGRASDPFTTLLDVWLQNSKIDSTPIGASYPSTGNFTTLAASGTFTGSNNWSTSGTIGSTGGFGGNLTGNVTGNLSGNVTGNVTGSVTGNSSTATALAATPSQCGSGHYATGIAASGNANCTTVLDQYASVGGCTFANDGGGLTCSPSNITWPAAFADTSYTATCTINYANTIAGGSSTQPVIILNWTPSSTTSMSIIEGAAQGSAGGFVINANYGVTIYCHGHHN